MYAHGVKRLLDLALSLVALPFVLAIMAVLAPLIRLEDHGPAFYNAPRIGKDGRPFVMYKLRSMRVNAPDLLMEDGSTYNGADDPRMTRIGAFMRKTSLDRHHRLRRRLRPQLAALARPLEARCPLRAQPLLRPGCEGLLPHLRRCARPEGGLRGRGRWRLAEGRGPYQQLAV